jgi:hypothetical protein
MSNSKTRNRRARLEIARNAARKARDNQKRMQRMRDEYRRIEREKENRVSEIDQIRITYGSY